MCWVKMTPYKNFILPLLISMNRLTHISKQFYISKPHQHFHENNKLKISEELDYECMYHFLTPSLMFYI